MRAKYYFLGVTPNGTAIRAIREARKIGLRTLAHLTGLDRGYLSKVERGLAGASEDTIRRIAEALTVPPADITRGEAMATTATETEQEVPHPTSPEGQIFLYTPEQASPHLRLSTLQIRRLISRREIAFTPSGGKRGGQNYLTGRQICEHIQKAEVRPIGETKPAPKKAASKKHVA